MVRSILQLCREICDNNWDLKNFNASKIRPSRNFAEVLRALDGLQTAASRGVATPANWNVGDDVVIPVALNDVDAKEKFGDFTSVLPYLRMTSLKG